MKKSRRLLFQRAPFLVAYWEDRQLIFENYLTRAAIIGDATTAAILHFFDRPRTLNSLVAHFDDFDPDLLRGAAAKLVRYSFLRPSNRAADPRETAMASWSSWNPAAGFLHFSSKDLRYARDPEVARFMKQKVKRSPLPSAIKRYPNAAQTELPPAQTSGEFPQVLQSRRTWRAFSRRPVSLADLSTLLGLTWRIHGWLEVPDVGRMPLKTSPSGGARHPIEAYVLAVRVKGLAPGLYHYRADRHRLELVREGATGRHIAAYLPAQPWFSSAAAMMLMTAVFPRTQWKYDFSRAYRVVLAEAGHLCQTFCLTATWLGLAPFCTMALADSRIEKDLMVDGVTESVLYAAGVGIPPESSQP